MGAVQQERPLCCDSPSGGQGETSWGRARLSGEVGRFGKIMRGSVLEWWMSEGLAEVFVSLLGKTVPVMAMSR